MDAEEQLGLGFFGEDAVPVPARKSRPRRRRDARDRRLIDHPQTRVKLAAYAAYITPWLRIAASQPTTTDIYVLDLFAGPGRYLGGETGSPVIACEAAIRIEARAISRARPIKCHLRFVEADRQTSSLLEQALAPYRDRLDIRAELGTAHQWASEFAAEALGHPTLVFLDPDGYKDVPFSMIRMFAGRRFTEVLINFDLQGTMRVAGIEDTSTLTAFYGDDMWRRDRRADETIDPDVFLEGYRRRLGEHFPFTEVRRIAFTQAHANRAIVQACGSLTGVRIWADCFVSAYEETAGVLVLEIAREVDRRSRIDKAIERLRELGEVGSVRYGEIAQYIGGLGLDEDDRYQLLLFLRHDGVVTWSSVLHRDAVPKPRFTFGRMPRGLHWDGVERPHERLRPFVAESPSA